ncbi:sigma-70 family RNA polymerase sigma factor [bacterium 210820-DFI.6.37]|nr:sigma-70 family RNA polymerase sigma factor [bacterium 210820-DFI.6.37]
MDIKKKEALLCGKYDQINRLLAIQNIKLPDREDLLHEIFIKAFRSLGKLREPDKIDSWLWKITRNEVNRYLRGIIKKRQWTQGMPREELENLGKEPGAGPYLPVKDELEQICQRDELTRALRTLPEKSLIVFRLHYYEGYSLSETAEIMGERYNTVKSWHRRGLEKLREILKEDRAPAAEQKKK